MESLKKKMRMEIGILYLVLYLHFSLLCFRKKKKKIVSFFFSLLSPSLTHTRSQSFSLSLSLSLCVWDIFKKFVNFRSIKKYLGWYKNVVHQTYYYFLPFGCWVSILLLRFDLHVLWFDGGDLGLFFFIFFPVGFFLCLFAKKIYGFEG